MLPTDEPSEPLPIDDTSFLEALDRYGIVLPKSKARKIHRYCLLLWEWNEKLNLTRHTDYDKFVTRDLVDSIQLAGLLYKGEHVLDVGTGGGVPGVPLAILRPDLRVELCDSTGKKAVAVGAILDQLKLKIPVWNAKAENLLHVHRFTTLLVRAVARMPKLLDWFAPHWHSFDRLLLIKGPSWVEERGESRHFHKLEKLALRKLVSYPIPGNEPDEAHDSVILQICRQEHLENLERVIGSHAERSDVAVSNKAHQAPKKKTSRSGDRMRQKKSDPPRRRKGDVKTKADLRRAETKRDRHR